MPAQLEFPASGALTHARFRSSVPNQKKGVLYG